MQPGNPVRHIGTQLSSGDGWIGLREKLIKRLGGIQEDEVLNVITAGSVPEYGTDPAAELKRALDMVKIAAVNESGVHVDYAALKDSPVININAIHSLPA